MSRYKPSAPMQGLIDSFAGGPNLGDPKTTEWVNLIALVKYAHAHSVKMRGGDLSRELQARGVSRRLSDRYWRFYEFGRGLLCRRGNWWIPH